MQLRLRLKVLLHAFLGSSGLLLGINTVAADPFFDGDRDGIPDEVDLCLYTGFGETVMANGCAPTGDRDQDGVDDSLDRCPRSPVGALVDFEGCSLDEDIDGVADGIDRCASTPLGYMVDAIGCTAGQTPARAVARPVPGPPPPVAASPAPVPRTVPLAPVPVQPVLPQAPGTTPVPIAVGPRLSAPPVVVRPAPRTATPTVGLQPSAANALRIDFRPYSALLSDEAQATLQTFAVRVLPVLEQFPNARVVVTGALSENEVGPAAYRLGVGRALTVKTFLRSVGIDKTRIETPDAAEHKSDALGSADIRLIRS